MNEAVFGHKAAPVTDDPAVFKRRRFSDPVSDMNAEAWDNARLLATAVEMVDGLGLHILSVEADRLRNRRIVVEHTPECAALEGVEIHRDAEWSHWSANRFGVEIRWCMPAKAVA